MRGVLGTLPMLMQTVGMLIMYIIGAYCNYYTVISIVVGFPIVTALLLVKAPESPDFLVKRGKINVSIQNNLDLFHFIKATIAAT